MPSTEERKNQEETFLDKWGVFRTRSSFYMWRIPLTRPVLLCRELVLHALCYALWGLSVTLPALFYVGSFSYAMLCYVGNISYIPHVLYVVSLSYRLLAMLCVDFLLHAPCYFVGEVSHTRPVLYYVGSFYYTPNSVLCGEFLLHAPFKKRKKRNSLARPILYYVGSSSYTPRAIIMWQVFLTRLILCYMGSFSYTPHVILCGEFLLHAPCYFVWGLSVTRPALFYVGSFSYTRHAILCW